MLHVSSRERLCPFTWQGGDVVCELLSPDAAARVLASYQLPPTTEQDRILPQSKAAR